MRIKKILDRDMPVSSPGANAMVDFSRLQTSVVAIETDIERGGKPVIGFGFGSLGRYAVGGLLRNRFIPRLMEAIPSDLVDEAGLIDPLRCWNAVMANEKPGGTWRARGGGGRARHGVVGCARQGGRRAPLAPARRPLSQRCR